MGSVTRPIGSGVIKAVGIQARKQFSEEEKRQILEEGLQNGIERVCAAYRIHDRTYYRWKKKSGYSKSPPRQPRPRRFTKEKVLAMAREAEKTSTKAVCEKYKINYSYFSSLRTELTGIRLARRFSPQEKLRILEEGY
jgi:transposase-like protein